MKIKSISKVDYSEDVYNLRIKSSDGLNHNYIANGINVSNCHKSRGNAIGQIIDSCTNWKYKLGLSGTMKLNEEYSDFFKIQERIGPLVMTLGAKFLQDKGYSPKIKIKQVYLEYDRSNEAVDKYMKIQEDKDTRTKIKNQFHDLKQFGQWLIGIEKDIIFDTEERLEFLSKFVNRLGKNTLILFSDIKNEYGKRIADKLKEWNDNTFYIDGGVDNSDRDDYKKMMESRNDIIIVASYGTFATGIDLKNVHHIIFAESIKAEITIRQAIGRGMRKLKGKIEVIIWDIIDDLSGYSIRHSNIRKEKIYDKQKFKILKPQIVKLISFKK